MTVIEPAPPVAQTIHPAATAIDPPVNSVQRRIGLLFGATGLTLFALMALLGLAMRLSQSETVSISEEWFYRLMTLHAAGMLAGMLLAMMGGLWYVVRSAVPMLNPGRALAAYVATILGVVLVLVSVVIGGFAAGWTFLYPLPFESAAMWSTSATVTFLIGMGLVGVGFTIYCIDVLKAVTEAYGGLAGALGLRWLRGRSSQPPPPQAIAATAVAFQGIIAGAVGMTILIALLDHTIDNTVTLDPLWAKNLTYFFGHTIANLIIYLAAGMLYVLIPLYAGRQWKTTKPIVIGWLGTITFVLTAYGHHLYMDFVQPGAVHVIGLVASSAASLPVAVVTIYTAMVLIWGSRYRWTLTSTLLFLGFLGWTIGGAGAVIDSLIPVNFRFHNTLWVPGHFHSYLMMGVSFWAMAFVSYLLERAAGRPAGRRVAILAPGLMLLGGYGLTYVWYFSGALGVPRRWAVHPEGTEIWSLVASLFVFCFLIGFFTLIAEFVRMAREGWRRRREMRDQPNPVETPVGLARDPRYGFQSMVLTQQGLIGMVMVGVAALFVFFPPIAEASEVSVKFHHLAHAVQFFAGAILGAAAGSAPVVLRHFPGRINGGLAVALIAPVVMLLVMIPLIYNDLLGNDFLHIAYHLAMVLLGLVTGLGAALLGRGAGWMVLLTSVAMALMFAPGVTGG